MTPTAENVELVGQIGGASYAVAVDDHYVYVGVGPRLVIQDATNPAHPVLVGQTVPLPGIVYGVAVAGHFAYVVTMVYAGPDGLQVIDVADPAAPVVIGSVVPLEGATGVTVVGGYAYVAGGSPGLRVIDVTNPTACGSRSAFIDTPGSASNVAVLGTLRLCCRWLDRTAGD